MRRRDVSKAILAGAIAAPFLSGCSDRVADSKSYPVTNEEIDAGVVPADHSYPPGSWRRYGADASGQLDSTHAITTAHRLFDRSFDDLGGTYRVSASIPLRPQCTIEGVIGRTELLLDNPNIPGFVSNGGDGVIVAGIRFRVLAVSSLAYIAPVIFSGCSGCMCTDCEFSGCSWAGVWLNDATHCSVARCYFHDFLGSVQDSADICIYNDASNNIITDNRCFGGNDHGILIENPYNHASPSNNLIAHNHIVNHTAYGVCVYVPDADDTFNRIFGNSIEDIHGTAFSFASGNGIYVAGAGGGGTVIQGNRLKRCCLQTQSRTEAPAAVGLHGMVASNAPIAILENDIEETARYDGILIVASSGPIRVAANTVRLLAGNLTGTPVRVEWASNVEISSNILDRPPSEGRCVLVYANGGNVTQVSVSYNRCSGGTYNQVEFTATGEWRLEQIECAHNTCESASGAKDASCIVVNRAFGIRLVGNACSCENAVAATFSNTRNMIASGNRFDTNGLISVVAVGDWSGSLYAADNRQNHAIVNLAAGLIVE